MFRKLHLQMTVFSTFVTSAILLIMTLVCLFIAERSMLENSYSNFSNYVYSCISHLEGQTLLSHQWLLQTENSYGIFLRIKDNGNPLFFEKLKPDEDKEAVFTEAAALSRDGQGLDLETPASMSPLTKSAVFKMDGYYAGTALIPKQNGLLSLIVLFPLDSLSQQILAQRFSFAAASAAAIVALAFFSYFFTRKLILPLEESRKQQTEFIAAASHELRSPLAVIQSSIQAMEYASPEEARRFFPSVRSESDRMARLIGDMLSLANADNNSWSILTSPCELDTLLLDTYEKYEPLMKERNLSFSVQIPEASLPMCSCDASRISQVLGILLDNARSYVPSGKKVILSLSLDTKAFCLSVADNGPGIPDADKKNVFERFCRLDASRNDKQHFGLGLSIAREIITLHKGSIAITDTPSGGTTFTILLPR